MFSAHFLAAKPPAATGGNPLPPPRESAPPATGGEDFKAAMSKASEQSKAALPAQPQPHKAGKTSATAPTVPGKPALTAKLAGSNPISAAVKTVAAALNSGFATPPAPAAPFNRAMGALPAVVSKEEAPSENQGEEKPAQDKSSDPGDGKNDPATSTTITAASAASTAATSYSVGIDISTANLMLALLGQTQPANPDLLRLTAQTQGGSSDLPSQIETATDSKISLVDKNAPSTAGVATKNREVTAAGSIPTPVAPSATASTSTAASSPATSATVTDSAAAKASAVSKAAATAVAPVTPVVPATPSISQVVLNQARAIQLKEVDSAISTDGTGVALSSQRMKFATEKNEIAGRAGQKVPTVAEAPAVAAASGASGATVQVVTPLDGYASGNKKDSADSSATTIDFSATLPALNVATGKAADAAAASNPAATQVDRIAHLVGQEVVMIRQSGANSLAVSLKVDPHTELYLQLTNHNGQVQATLSCERGNAASLGGHWNDLQESLAKQNVQLMPLEDKTSARIPVVTAASPTASHSPNFNQSSQNPARQNRNLDDSSLDSVAAKPLAGANANSKTKTRTASRPGWESWA